MQVKVVGLLEGKRNNLQLAFQELEDRLDSLLKVVEEAVTLVFAASEIKDTCFLRTGWPYYMAIESFYYPEAAAVPTLRESAMPVREAGTFWVSS